MAKKTGNGNAFDAFAGKKTPAKKTSPKIPAKVNNEIKAAVDKAIANKAKDIAGLIEGRGMRFPENMAGDVVVYVARCVDAVEQAQKIVNELDELIETGFKGIEVSKVEKMLVELDEIESGTDQIQVGIRSELFKIEKDLPPIDVMFMYKIIEWIGDIADHAETVGSRLQLMLAK